MFLINGLNWACNNIAASYKKVEDEFMSAIRFHMTSKGDLPILYYFSRKMESLEIDFKVVLYSITV